MFKITGLEELQNKLSNLAEKASELDGKHSVPIADLLTADFLSGHFPFRSIDDLFRAGGFKVETTGDLEAIPGDKLDEFIRSISSFDSWQSLLAKAGEEWAAKQLGL